MWILACKTAFLRKSRNCIPKTKNGHLRYPDDYAQEQGRLLFVWNTKCRITLKSSKISRLGGFHIKKLINKYGGHDEKQYAPYNWSSYQMSVAHSFQYHVLVPGLQILPFQLWSLRAVVPKLTNVTHIPIFGESDISNPIGSIGFWKFNESQNRIPHIPNYAK